MNDVIIIGAGPAGLSAAVTCARKGLQVLVIDEYMKPGGRLLGQLYEQPDGTWWNGIQESARLHRQATDLGVQILLNTPVHNLERDEDQWTIYTEKNIYSTNHLLLATGAAESPVPVPGWTLPGVMSVGAAQVMTNVHRVKPGERGVIIGVNALSAVIASELQMAGVNVAALALPERNKLTQEAAQPESVMNDLLHVAHMAPSALMRFGSKLMKNDLMKQLGITFYPKSGFKMWGIPIQLRKAVVEIYGNKQVEGVKIATVRPDGDIIPGTEETISCDFVCIAGGLYPLTELAAVAGCPFYLIDELGGYVPLHNNRMETALDGLYVAGNITGIEGAKIAIDQGTVAGLTIAANHGVNELENEIEQAIASVSQTRDQAPFQFDPNVRKGKRIMQEKWEEYQRSKSEWTVG
ncbi:NAD(P)/FAD-dependent oxidoreductase [Lentibacillus cibarius]|uniref:NAD(P)/FAD-dependent oxidoreductase n=1 Tax=Lentibacillus cibarius TaxID=2583219 RepID=A0A549YEK2_9BACI|nr:NAD(P)/FAD-dependent oxidoreductase [Lentibacillus cibarius]TMN21441.1 NAD(P)/FAD-dependent oxidoreductase [Lentibacillus cibarius]TRM10319.1 NAD(P)/FAD-dependent oxidoreductase [Lentibacillus cibarius]